MRYVCLAAATFAAFSSLVQTAAFAQGPQPAFSITNYQYVGEQRLSQTTSYVTYRASLVNPGPARNAVTASVTSRVSSAQVVAGQGNLHFSPVPANSTVPSLDTFTILLDRSIAFEFADLQWSFLSPVANAGLNRTAKVGDLVILDGTGSTNPSGFGYLQYNWKLVSTPVGSSAVLYWYDTAKPQFTLDVPGTYTVNLTVSNGSGSDSATVAVSTTNTPPVANAGANRTVSPGTVVTLNGSGSSDADGDPLTFSWTFLTKPAGSTAALLAPNSVSPVFTVDKPGSYDFRLIVNDGKVNSAPSTVTITTQNTAPVSNAGPNQVRTVGSLVQLDGSGSTDVDGDPLTYQWSLITLPGGSTATLSSTTAVKPTFTADRAGTYVAQLIVNDGKVASAASTVQVTTNPPLAPTAIAGPNQTVAHRTTVRLAGNGTDPQGLPLTFQWSLSSKPSLSNAVLSSATVADPTFVADMPGTYVAQLIVNNGILPSAASMVTITTTNTAPVANPGLNQFVPVSAVVSLSGAGSSDADGDSLTFAWSFTSRPNESTAVLSSLTSTSPTFLADVAGTYVVQLIVSDGYASSSPATVTITAGVKTISLTPNPLNLSTNTPGFLTVTMGSLAGPGGQIVALDSSNGTIASIQANVTVPQGMAGVNVPVTPGSGAGSTTITAFAFGFTAGTAVVNVSAPAVTVALSSGTVGLTRTVNGTLTLSAPAPTGGVSVTLSDPAGIVTFQPASVSFAAGATTATFSVKGTAVGATTIVAGAPGYNTGTANVTVAMLGAINLLSNVSVGPSQSVAFPVSLVTGAPSGGVTISLSSSDTSKVTISPASVTILQGATTPAQQPTITGVNLGTADISASAPGLLGATETVHVAATLSFQQQTLTLGVNGTQNLVLNLSGPAPSNGLTVNINSSNSAVATVPTTVSFSPNQTTVNVPVSGIAIGTSTIHASALPALADTTATVNVVNVGPIGLPANASVGLGQTATFPVTLPTSAPAGGVTVSFLSSDPSRLTISPASVSIPAGQTGPATQPTITGVNVGTANITASATGFTASTQPVQVTASLSFAVPSVTITGAATANVALNLSGPAPAGGLTVNLSASNGSVAGVPSTVRFAANTTSVNVPVTGGTAGSTVIRASATNIPETTLNVTVVSAGTINLPVSLAPALGQSLALAVSLSTAPTSTVTVTLASSDASKVSLSSTTVTIPAGQTSPVVQPQVTGINIGSVTITATAPGYTSGSSAVQVSATIGFTQQNTTITGTVTQNLTLTLSAAAPAGGVTINLNSSNPAAATVPATVTFAQAATTTNVPVTGVAAGTAVIRASNLPNIAAASANVTVQVFGSINLPSSPSVGLSQTIPFPVTLSAPAASAVTVALVSSDTSKLTISASSVSIAAGATAPVQQPTIAGVNLGSANISATAAGYSSGSAIVPVTATLAFTPPTVSFSGSGTQNLTLTLSGQAPSGGLAINLSSSNPSVGTVPSTVTIPQGSTTVAVPFTIVSSGSTVIHASKSPYLADTTANVTVQSSMSLPATLSVAPGQQTSLILTLGTPAPAGGVTVSLSSSDTSKVTLVSGSVFVAEGQTTPNASPAVNGINFGSVTITASANGYSPASTTVQVSGSASFFPSTLSLTSGAGAHNLSLTLSSPAPSNITFTLNSSNAGVATAPASVVIPANQNNVNVPIMPVGAGTTIITASTVTPNIASTTATVTVSSPGTITLPSVVLAPQQSAAFPITLGTAAPSGGVTVNLSSSDTSKVTITPASVTITAGQTTPATQPTVTGVNYGTANINATAPGYTSATSQVKVTATISFASPTVTINGITTQNVALNLSSPAPPGGLLVNLSSSNTNAVTVPVSVSFAANASTVNVVLAAAGPGSATITAAPAVAGIANATTSVTVLNPGTINLPPSGGLGLGKTASFPVTLSSPAAAPVSIALASSDSSKVTISAATVSIATGQTAPVSQPTITGVGLGASNITATAIGYSSASSAVQVSASVVFSPASLSLTGTETKNLTLTLSAPAPAGGVLINLSSSNASVATVPLTATFTQGSTTLQVPVTAVAPGSATIHAGSALNIPDSTASVTVQGGITLASNVTVPPGQTAPIAVTLGIPAPSGGVTVSLSSSDPSKVTLISESVFIAQGATTPATPPSVKGISFGNSTISASANGYGSAQASVQVTGSASFFPATITLVSGAGAQNLSLTLSVPAPSALTFNLSSSNAAAATVPVSVTIPANQNNVNVPVTPLSQGSTTITASTSTPNIANTTAAVTITAPGTVGLPANMSVGLSTTVDFPFNLGAPAPAGGVTVSLVSSNTSKLTISPESVNIAAGQTAPATHPKVTGSDIGAVTITASAPGHSSAVAQAQVTASIGYAPTSLSIVGTATQNFVLTLSGSAPPGGIAVAVSSSNTGVATVPQQVTFFQSGNKSTALLPVTGVAPGSAVIHVSATPFIPDTTATVSVLSPGVIGLPSNVSVGPTQSVPFPVTLGTPAPTGGVTVSLSSSNTSKLTISPASVSIAEGQITPATQPNVAGVDYGTANITATAPGYVSANAAVQVAATLTFASPTVTINGITTQNVSLNLSAPAPAGGLTVNLSSSNTSIATVPVSVNFPASSTSANVLITALGVGLTTITATPAVSGIANATTNVTVQSAGGINLPASPAVNLGQTVALPVTLSQAPASNVTIALSSSDTSKVTISTSSVTILAGQTAPAVQPTITGVNLGSANITATAAGYTSASAGVQVTATVSFTPPSSTIVGSGTKNLTLTLSSAAPAGGVTVNLSSSNTSAATVPATVTFNQGQSTTNVPVTAVAAGTTVIHASKLPSIADATASVTVAAAATVNLPSNPTVGLGASATFAITLTNPAAADLTIALASSDASKVTISPASVTILTGQTAPATQPTIQGVNLGSASISATGTGVTSASTTVQVNATISFAQSNVSITGSAAQNVALTLSGAAPAGGLTINLTSSNTGVATVPLSVSFSAGSTSVNVLITPVSPGSTTITASTAAPNVPSTTTAVSVAAAGVIGVPSNPIVLLGQSAPFAVTLPQAAPASVSIALSSSDSSRVTISPASVTIAAGQTTPATQPTITGVKPGSANIIASAPGYTSNSASVQVNATVSFTPPSLTIPGFATKNLTLTLSAPAPAGGITINLSSSTPANATVPPTVTFSQGATTVNVPVTGLKFGTTVVHASALPNIPDATADVTVQSAGAIGVPANTSMGLNQSGTFAISLPAPAPAPVTVTVSSSDSSKVSVSAGPFTIPTGATTPTTQPQLTGVNIGAVTITASAAGYTNGTGAAQTNATVSFAQPTVTIAGIVTQNVVLNLSAPAPSGGVTVNLSSATPGVATVPATAIFAAGASSVNVPVTAVSLGTAVIHASSTPYIPDAATTVTVQSGGSVVVPSSSTVNLGASAPLTISLSAPAPAPLTVTLTSGAASTATISPATVSIAQGATAPATQPSITGVNIGTVNITAAAPGYTTGTTSVQVNASVTFPAGTTTITGLKTQNVTLTLSAAAPPAGITVNLTSSNTAVATVPLTVSFAGGATTATVPVTSLSVGSTVIHASATPFIPDATANVSVVSGGPIGVPASVNVSLGASATFAVSLPQAAPASGTTITLSSADTSKVTVTPATVTIAAGQTTPATQPTVRGVNVGSASVSASAPGFTTSSRTVTVGATVSWPQSSFTLSATGTQNVTLTLSAAAPTGGLIVNLSSSNLLVATVPTTATFPAGASTVQVPVTALSEGSTVFHASGTNIPDAAANVTVALPTLGVFTVSNVTVGQNLQTQLQINLSNPVPPGLPLQVTLTSSDGSKLVIGSLVVQGTTSTILSFPAGSTSGIAYAQALASSGTVTVTASAPGYTSGSGTVTLTPSGFVVIGPTGVVGVASFPTNLGNTTPLTVSTARLSPSLNFVESQGLRGGFSVSVSLSSLPLAVGQVSPASLSFTPADTAYTTTFSALGVGNALVSAVTPTGFSTPAGGASGITANVSPGGVTAPNVTVGQSLEVSAQVTLSGAPSADAVLTLVSSDASRLRFGTSPTDPGAGTIPIPGCTPPVPDPNNACKIVKVRAGQSHSPDFYIQALDSSGSATYTASIAGFGTSTGTVAFRPSGILIAGPFGLANSFSVATGSLPTTLTIESAMLDTSRNVVALQLVAPINGISPVSVNVSSLNTNVGRITASPVSIPAGSAGVTTAFQAVSSGSTTVSVNVPTGFTAPAAYGSVAVDVSTAGIAITDSIFIGKFLQVHGNFALGSPAPAGLVVTLTSLNPSLLLLSTSPTAGGAASIPISMSAGGTSGSYYLQALASSGTATYTASAPGYATRTGTITLTPSGVVLGDSTSVGGSFGGWVFGNPVVVSLAQLAPGDNTFMEIQQLAGGLAPVSIAMSTTVAGATITTPVKINPGTDSVNAVLTGSSGSGQVTAASPPGFTPSNFGSVNIFF